MSGLNWMRTNWGSVAHLSYSADVGISLLQIDRATRCSIHRHHARSNIFVVASGIVIVEVWHAEDHFSGSNDPCQIHVLRKGQAVEVEPLRWHRFRVYESGQMVEIYLRRHGPVCFEDIERWNQGGPDDIHDLEKLVETYG